MGRDESEVIDGGWMGRDGSEEMEGEMDWRRWIGGDGLE